MSRLNQIRGRLQEADHIFEPPLRADVLWLLDEVDRLRKALEQSLTSHAEMSYNGRLVSITSTGMREVIDEATRLRRERDELRSRRGHLGKFRRPPPMTPTDHRPSPEGKD